MATENEQIKPTTIEQEMQTSFMEYSMSVIVSRALPDVRDGLKPVHRRILYAMNELNLAHNRPFRKSAAIVGETMGKYHPHGDGAIYDTLVRMAQPWNMRYPLVNGQGNFGSIDGDSPAAMRYTESRMEAITSEMLAHIDKNTVDMVENYDGREHEPAVLPSAIPNLLVNGSYGIAVGMATSCPPHNLTEVCNAIMYYIDNPEATTINLMRFVKGPDFPTGGIICGRAGIHQAFTTGRGRIRVRAKIAVEVKKESGRESLIVQEIPYQINKTNLIETIARLVHEKTIDGISDLRDESDKDGMRLVIELKKGEEPQVVLNQLYKHTQLQSTASVIMLALVNNQPRVLNLKEMIHYYVAHRAEIVERRCRFELEKAEARAHIVEGFLRAIDSIDEVIAIIRSSNDSEEANRRLIERFDFSVPQANAILAMRLRSLTGLEREKLELEYADLLKEIERLRHILSSDKTILAEVRKEIEAVREKYGDERRTEILESEGDFQLEDLIADENMVVTITNGGYIKRLPVDTYRKQRRGGRGINGMATKEADFVKDLFIASAHQYLLFFTNLGKVYWRKVHELPKASRQAQGRAIINVLSLEKGENVSTVLPVRDLQEENYIFMVTRQGTVKKTFLKAFSNPRQNGIIAITLQSDDELIATQITSGKDNILIATHNGMAIRFPERDVNPVGRTAQGVRGIRLSDNDYVVGVSLGDDEMTVLNVTENGFGKRTKVGDYRLQHRGGSGIINIKTSDRNGTVVGMLTVNDDDEIVVVATDGVTMRTPVKDFRVIGRNTQGVRLMNLSESAKVSAVARAIADKIEESVTEGLESITGTNSTTENNNFEENEDDELLYDEEGNPLEDE